MEAGERRALIDRAEASVPPTLIPWTRVKFDVDMPPTDNNLYGHQIITPRGGKPFAKRYLTREAQEYKQDVARRAALAGLRIPSPGDCIVIIDIFRQRRAGDAHGHCKALLDALTGIAWVDDSQIAGTVITRNDDPGNPRATIEIRRIGQ